MTLVLIGLVGGIITGLSPCVLPVLPVVSIGGIQAAVTFAGLAAPGLFQFNVQVPPAISDGDIMGLVWVLLSPLVRDHGNTKILPITFYSNFFR